MTSQPYNLERSFQDARPGTPIFVFLSPGVDVAGSVEALGRKLGFTAENGKYFSVSLGQGQVWGWRRRVGWMALERRWR